MIENKTTGFKREYMDDIKYAVVAFASTEGGKLYIGIDDSGSIKGIEDTDDTDDDFNEIESHSEDVQPTTNMNRYSVSPAKPCTRMRYMDAAEIPNTLNRENRNWFFGSDSPLPSL